MLGDPDALSWPLEYQGTDRAGRPGRHAALPRLAKERAAAPRLQPGRTWVPAAIVVVSMQHAPEISRSGSGVGTHGTASLSTTARTAAASALLSRARGLCIYGAL